MRTRSAKALGAIAMLSAAAMLFAGCAAGNTAPSESNSPSAALPTVDWDAADAGDVQDGGTLITEGSTTTILPDFGIISGVNVETPAGLFVRGSILRSKVTDLKSPLTYGFSGSDLPVYFNQAPVLSAGGGFGGFGGGSFGGGGASGSW